MLFKILKALVLLKFSIKKPQKSKIVIFDRIGSELIEKYFKEVKLSYHIVDTRLESLNLFIILKLILARKPLTFKNYIILYLRTLDCSTVISGIDNNLLFLTLKKFLKEKRFICIQQGWRSPKFFNNKLKNLQNAELDLMFTFNKKFSDIFSKFIKSKFIEIGSFKNNLTLKKKSSSSNSIGFVSEISIGSRKNLINLSNYKVKSEDFYSADIRLIQIISNYCTLNKINFKIIGKYDYQWEKKFYKNILKDTDYTFIPNYKDRNVYKICDNTDLVVGTFSTLLLENLARGNKTLVFNTKIKPVNDLNYNIFFPNNIDKEGDFWTDSVDKNKVNEYLEKYYIMEKNVWNSVLEHNKDLIIKFDTENSIFKKNLSEFL